MPMSRYACDCDTASVLPPHPFIRKLTSSVSWIRGSSIFLLTHSIIRFLISISRWDRMLDASSLSLNKARSIRSYVESFLGITIVVCCIQTKARTTLDVSPSLVHELFIDPGAMPLMLFLTCALLRRNFLFQCCQFFLVAGNTI